MPLKETEQLRKGQDEDYTVQRNDRGRNKRFTGS
jgi:hypothetical protein